MSDLLKDATVRPWEVADKGDYSDFDGTGIVLLGDDRRIAVVQGMEANARLIVTAVNSYEPMLAALEAMLGQYVGLVNCGDCGHWNPETEDEVIAARAAIALAKVQS